MSGGIEEGGCLHGQSHLEASLVPVARQWVCRQGCVVRVVIAEIRGMTVGGPAKAPPLPWAPPCHAPAARALALKMAWQVDRRRVGGQVAKRKGGMA